MCTDNCHEHTKFTSLAYYMGVPKEVCTAAEVRRTNSVLNKFIVTVFMIN
jgi:hypothetical protein